MDSDHIPAEDRISKLPDSILSHILSFLPTKYSVRTSCLSKRWRFAWTWVVVLNLDDRYLKPYHFQKKRKKQAEEDQQFFKNVMNKVLILRSDICVKKFRLQLTHTHPTSDVHSWIWAAVAHNIEELDLYIKNGYVKLPMILFNSATLVILKLHKDVELNVPESASLPSLKVLHLQSLSMLCDADIDRLLSGSPLLQELLIRLYFPHRMKRYSILSLSLKSLIMEIHTRHSFGNQVVIDTPKLEYLEFIGIGGEGIYVEVKNTPSIVKATLHLSYSSKCDVPENRAMTFSQCSFRNVKVLSVSLLILKAALFNGDDIGFNYLTKLVMSYCGADLSILPQILLRLPILEFLILNKAQYCNHTVTCEVGNKKRVRSIA